MVSTAIAVVLLWGFVIWGLVEPKYMNAQVQEWKTWISNNFSWFYIAAFVSQPSTSPTIPKQISLLNTVNAFSRLPSRAVPEVSWCDVSAAAGATRSLQRTDACFDRRS